MGSWKLLRLSNIKSPKKHIAQQGLCGASLNGLVATSHKPEPLVYILRKGDIMANLTRYSFELDIQGGKPIAHFVIDKNGSWVNFEESKEFLKTHTNTKSMPLFPRDDMKSLAFILGLFGIPYAIYLAHTLSPWWWLVAAFQLPGFLISIYSRKK